MNKKFCVHEISFSQFEMARPRKTVSTESNAVVTATSTPTTPVVDEKARKREYARVQYQKRKERIATAQAAGNGKVTKARKQNKPTVAKLLRAPETVTPQQLTEAIADAQAVLDSLNKCNDTLSTSRSAVAGVVAIAPITKLVNVVNEPDLPRSELEAKVLHEAGNKSVRELRRLVRTLA